MENAPFSYFYNLTHFPCKGGTTKWLWTYGWKNLVYTYIQILDWHRLIKSVSLIEGGYAEKLNKQAQRLQNVFMLNSTEHEIYHAHKC